jgi:hypothetical protein
LHHAANRIAIIVSIYDFPHCRTQPLGLGGSAALSNHLGCHALPLAWHTRHRRASLPHVLTGNVHQTNWRFASRAGTLRQFGRGHHIAL